MTTGQWIIVDLVVALLSVAAWLAAGVTMAIQRHRLAVNLLVAAVLVTLARGITVTILASHGWWFVQERVLLGLPMLAATAVVAVLVAGRRLLAARRTPSEAMSVGSVVWLLTTAYAALAGFLVSFLAGYPLTWSSALIAISLVCAGGLMTARVVAIPVKRTAADSAAPAAAIAPAPARHSESEFSRRRFISLAGGAVVAGTGLTGVGLLFMPAESVATGGGPARSSGSRAAVSVINLRGAGTPAPGGTKRQYTLTAQTAAVRLPSGEDVDAWTYNGHVPGPAITAAEGDLIEVTLRNANIPDGVTLHWHGYDVPCGEDGAPGVTQHAVAPGDEFLYHFRADRVGTYWYHTHQASHRGVRKGLYGTLVVTPRDTQRAGEVAAPQQLDLTLPVHTFDSTVVIAGQAGRIEHSAPPAGALVRLRLINTDSDPHRFALAGTPFRVAAVDGRDLHQPGEVREVGLRLPAGGRYDLLLAMPDTPVALIIDGDHNSGMRLSQGGATGEDPAVADTSGWPELDLLHYGEPAAVPFDAGKANRHFTIVLDRGVAIVDGAPAYAQTVNGRGHPSIPDQLVAEGDIVRVTVVNRSLETHPWHLHGHPVLILSRDGRPSSGSPLWMDTFDVRPGQVWEVAFAATNPGIWMNHCHNLPHADQGMMLRLCYDGVTTPFHGSHTCHRAGTAGSRSHGH